MIKLLVRFTDRSLVCVENTSGVKRSEKTEKNIILRNDIFLVRIITENVSRTSEKEYRGERKLLISAIYNCFEMHWNLKIE